MKQKIALCIAVTFSLMVSVVSLRAQDASASIASDERSEVVDSIGDLLNANYVFPEVAKEMTELIMGELKRGAYDNINDAVVFANQLTDDLRSVSHDLHLRVTFDPKGIAEQNQVHTAEDSAAFLQNYVDRLKRRNFGFKQVKILDGNIGYLDLRSFADTEYGGETAVAAMNFLSNVDALIIDLRYNGGGSPAMIQLITSYLYNSEPVHLNNFYWRPTDLHTQTWTLPHVQGTRNPDADVYVLTSGNTFSAAEEFSYNLKNLERATLVGETTGGGAHPGGSRTATDRFMIWIPTGRAISPITNTNWEGTGVSPHIATTVEEAFDVAYLNSLEVLNDKCKDEGQREYYEWQLKGLKAKVNPIIVDESVLKSYVGTYGPRGVTFRNGRLIYQRQGAAPHDLTPLSQNEFMLDDYPTFRLKFVVEDGMPVAVVGMYEGGRTDRNPKDTLNGDGKS